MRKNRTFKFAPFSRHQRMVLNWWCDGSPVKDKAGIIADGSIRSGKTISMSLSFVLWSMTRFDGEAFIMAGKTVGAFRRNVLRKLIPMLRSRGYEVSERKSENLVIISNGERENEYYIFGGQDEGSQDAVQGITAAGAYLDEVALMPESFVRQVEGRCSVDGSKLWYNCNPEGPLHWFKTSTIDMAKERGLLYLHFTMDDNLTLSEKIKARYRSMFAGVFYLRFILGLWKMAEGPIYTMLTDANYYHTGEEPIALKNTAHRVISVDYGTTNPCVFLETYDDGTTIWVDREYRWDNRSEAAIRSGNAQKTDAQYADDMLEFMGKKHCGIYVDPSAASFIQELRSRGLVVTAANNEVMDGIRKVSALIARKKIMINADNCTGLLGEMQSYAWDDKAAKRGEEKPLKIQDHGPDALRYRINALPAWRVGI